MKKRIGSLLLILALCFTLLLGAALGLGVKICKGIYLIVPQLHTDGHFLLHGEDIRNGTSHGKLGGAFHLVAAGVACGDKAAYEVGELHGSVP